MAIKVYVSDSTQYLAIGLYVVLENEGQRKQLLHMSPDGLTREWEEVDPSGVAQKPTFFLDYEIAHQVQEALDTYFEGSSDVLQARKDVEFERKRAEKMLDSILNQHDAMTHRIEMDHR